jgi:hypothetical protein
MRNILQSLNAEVFLPKFKEGEICQAICAKEGIEKLDTPSPCINLKCPICGYEEGYRLFDPAFGTVWACKRYCRPKEKTIPIEEIKISSGYQPKPRRMEDLGVPYLYENCTLDGCKNQIVKDFLKDWAKEPKGFILFVGSSGRGKTFTACSAIDLYRNNFKNRARFINVSNLYVEWRKCFTDNKSEMDLFSIMKSEELLVLDDIGIRTPSEGFLDFLYLIINARSEEPVGTIVTTNLTSVQMMEKFGDAITSRLCSGKIFKFEGKDQRLTPEF